MNITFIGLNHKTAPVEVRERICFPPDRIASALDALLSSSGIKGGVILSTCNRTEIYASTAEGTDGFDALLKFICTFHEVSDRDILPHLYAADDLDTANHLFNVACSLDSLVLGEQQILGQVREAYKVAAEHGTTDAALDQLFKHALVVGKEVRSQTDIGKNHVSISTMAVDLAKHVFDDLGDRTVLVVGAGEMGCLTARYLSDNGVGSMLIINRTYDRALALANELSGRVMPFEELRDCLSMADIVISSTSSNDYVISPEDLDAACANRKGRSLLLIDIAVPRDIDPACERFEDVFLYSLDDLEKIAEKNRSYREIAAKQAARMVGDEVREFESWLEGGDATATIRALRSKADQIRTGELDRLYRRTRSLDADERSGMEAAAEAMMNKLLHTLTVTLRKEAGTTTGSEYALAVRKLFDLNEEEDPS